MTPSRLLLAATAAAALVAWGASPGTARAQAAPPVPAADGATIEPGAAMPSDIAPLETRFVFPSAFADTTPRQGTRPRRHAVEYGEWYSRRLTIHRYASYTMPPLFVAEYLLGDKMLDEKRDVFAGRGNGVSDGTRTTHAVVAGAIGALFAVNTVTGLWNLYESRHTAEGRTKRTVHTLLMLGADAGFTATGILGARAVDRGVGAAETHRNVALGSMGLATAGAVMMWFFRN